MKAKCLVDYCPPNHDSVMDELMWFCRERQWIYRAKEAGHSAPWTKDKTLQTKKFCNIFRDQDRLSVFINGWLLGTDQPFLNVLYARFACKQSVLEMNYLEDWLPDDFLHYIADLSGGKIYDKNGNPKSNKNAVWGCPYQVASSFSKIGYRSREEMMIHHLPRVSDELYDIVWNIRAGEDLQESGCLAAMKKVLGFGAEFVMIQCVLDMVMIGHAPDDITFPLGPGAKPILDMFDCTRNELIHSICREWNVNRTHWARTFGRTHLARTYKTDRESERTMHPHDAEQALCEYRKYITWRDGSARGKIYRGGT